MEVSTPRVLVIYYSQTGQLKDIIHNFMIPFYDNYQIDYLEIKTDEYKFPLTFNSFFEAFPESVLGGTCQIFYESYDYAKYEIIVFGFQPWFLHLSVPFNSYIESSDFGKAVKNKQVFLVADCRSTWRNTTEYVTEKIHSAGGTVMGEFIFRDVSAGNLVGAVTLLKWLGKGKKVKLFNRFPLPGVDIDVIERSNKYGEKAVNILSGEISNSFLSSFIIPEREGEFTSKGYEQFVIKKFKRWAGYIIEDNNKYRKRRLFTFKIWIIFTIIFIAPFISKKYKQTNNSLIIN